MARQTVITLDADSAIALKEVKKFSGYYIGFKLADTGNEKPSTLHVFKTEGGSVGVWGFKRLDEQLLGVPKGAMTWLEYLGVGKSHAKGRKPPHLCSVEFDPDLSISVSGVAIETETSEEPSYREEGNGSGGSEESSEPDYGDVDGDEDIEAAAPTKPMVKGTPGTVSAEQRARAMTALNNARNGSGNTATRRT